MISISAICARLQPTYELNSDRHALSESIKSISKNGFFLLLGSSAQFLFLVVLFAVIRKFTAAGNQTSQPKNVPALWNLLLKEAKMKAGRTRDFLSHCLFDLLFFSRKFVSRMLLHRKDWCYVVCQHAWLSRGTYEWKSLKVWWVLNFFHAFLQ